MLNAVLCPACGECSRLFYRRYEPATTAAVVLCGGDEEAEAAAAEVCKDAEIASVVLQSAEQQPTVYLKYGRQREDE